jgi:tetratricopeptide (TPR) repeat protein
MTVIMLHVIAGVLAAVLLVPFLVRNFRNANGRLRVAFILLAVGAALGLALMRTGSTRPHTTLFYSHILIIVFALVLMLWEWLERRRFLGNFQGASIARLVAALAAVAVIGAGLRVARTELWRGAYKIQNPRMPPASMESEGDGPNGPFFPSSSQTKDGKLIPPKFFMESESCQRCHNDIYQQWFGSMHHMSSFNNQWYRKSIEYMQDVVGTKPSKWCGGCHDPAVIFSGMMDTPIKEIVNRPEAHAGLGCMICHSMVKVKSSMGQGDYLLEYPKLHELAASENALARTLHDFLVKVNPEPHRRAFLKPFHREQTAEFCSSCHKVHLDIPVNHYRWIRGFNDYDNWQASAVSGQGARSFYYPAETKKCADCHMPLVESSDFGNIAGKVHSHRFPAANTALPVAYQDAEQFEATKKFLSDKILSVDIFALSPVQKEAKRASAAALPKDMSTSFAVGEEAEFAAPKAELAPPAPLTAPLNRVKPAVRRGDEFRLDVVVRTRKIGHFFPAGTVDAFDVWLELQATDETGRVLFWSGKVEDNGKGPVERGAHFYRSLMVDARGNPINKRNAWATRALVYVRLIPPSAADTVHFNLRVPPNAGKELRLKAKLNYRKFSWYNTQFSYAGEADPAKGGEYSSEFDDRTFVFTGDVSQVSGKLKQIPDLPIVTLAQDEVTLPILAGSQAAPAPKLELASQDWERWNDYGIGLLLQGDLKAAELAFQKATEIDRANPDGWVNIGRVRVQEGDTAGARQVLEKALALKPDLARANFFYGRALRADGEYDRAIEVQRKVAAQYPRDRVVRNELGRLLFLKRRYQEAVKELEAVLDVDPEDLQAHYNLMLCYRGLGNETQAAEHQKRYLRFKADEAAQAITGPYRQLHPEDNRERQAIHEHYSVPLAQTRSAAVKKAVSIRGY